MISLFLFICILNLLLSSFGLILFRIYIIIFVVIVRIVVVVSVAVIEIIVARSSRFCECRVAANDLEYFYHFWQLFLD